MSKWQHTVFDSDDIKKDDIGINGESKGVLVLLRFLNENNIQDYKIIEQRGLDNLPEDENFYCEIIYKIN